MQLPVTSLMTGRTTVTALVTSLISGLLLIRCITCSPSLVMISNEIYLSTRRPLSSLATSMAPVTVTPVPGIRPPPPLPLPRKTDTSGRVPQASPSGKKGLSGNGSSSSNGGSNGPEQTRRIRVPVSLDELLVRVKRRPARGSFGNTGRHGPRDRLDYNASPTIGLSSCLLFLTAVLVLWFPLPASV